MISATSTSTPRLVSAVAAQRPAGRRTGPSRPRAQHERGIASRPRPVRPALQRSVQPTKGAVEAIAETYRYELAAVGVDSVIVEPGVYATRFFEKAASAAPADAGRAAEYAELGRLSREMQSRRPAAGDPREVAAAIAELIERPAGSRPLRTTVGWGAQRAEGLNAVSEDLQRTVLDGLGVRDQLTMAPRLATTTEV